MCERPLAKVDEDLRQHAVDEHFQVDDAGAGEIGRLAI